MRRKRQREDARNAQAGEETTHFSPPAGGRGEGCLKQSNTNPSKFFSSLQGGGWGGFLSPTLLTGGRRRSLVPLFRRVPSTSRLSSPFCFLSSLAGGSAAGRRNWTVPAVVLPPDDGNIPPPRAVKAHASGITRWHRLSSRSSRRGCGAPMCTRRSRTAPTHAARRHRFARIARRGRATPRLKPQSRRAASSRDVLKDGLSCPRRMA